jgi:alkylation response protein AidB-like acyl-CoA dehydrogenase
VTWNPGFEQIRELLDKGSLDVVAADTGVARRLLDDAGQHIDSAAAIADAGDLIGAYQLAYDARNSFEYPSAETGGPTRADVADSIEAARSAREAAEAILGKGVLTPWATARRASGRSQR